MAPLVRVALVREPSPVPYRLQASTAGIAQLAHEAIGTADREHILVYLLDAHHRILGVHTAAIGTMTEAQVDVGGIFRVAILAAANALIVAHNHPSGHPVLSGPDRELFDRVQQAGLLFGIKVLDMVVVTPDRGSWGSLAADREHLKQAERDREREGWDEQRLARRERANRSPEEREAFAAALAEGKADPGDFASMMGGGVTLRRLAERLYMATGLLPDPARQALGLRTGASYAVAARRLLREWKASGAGIGARSTGS
jgi:DNA repair protein RadC